MKSQSVFLLALAATLTTAAPATLLDHPISDESNLYTRSQFEQRACPHVHEVDGVKRCIGSRKRRDLEPGAADFKRWNYGDHSPNKRNEDFMNPMKRERELWMTYSSEKRKQDDTTGLSSGDQIVQQPTNSVEANERESQTRSTYFSEKSDEDGYDSKTQNNDGLSWRSWIRRWFATTRSVGPENTEQRMCLHKRKGTGQEYCIMCKDRRGVESLEAVPNKGLGKRMCPHNRDGDGQEDCIISKDRQQTEPFEYEPSTNKRLAGAGAEPFSVNILPVSDQEDIPMVREGGRVKERKVTGSNSNQDGELLDEVLKRACPHVRDISGEKRCIGSKGRRDANAEAEPLEDVVKRTCPHVREVDGVKRCIGNKQRRDKNTAKENESPWVGIDGYSSDKDRRDDCPTCDKKRHVDACPTCIGKLKGRDTEQQVASSRRNFDNQKRGKVISFKADERDDCPSCDEKSKRWSSGSSAVVTDPHVEN